MLQDSEKRKLGDEQELFTMSRNTLVIAISRCVMTVCALQLLANDYGLALVLAKVAVA